MQLVQPNHQVLNSRAEINPFDTDVDWSVREKDMFQLMEDRFGIGLAAPQIGDNYRMFVMRHSTKGNIGIYNPEILATSEDKVAQEEGCLSFPLLFFMVTRPATCMVKFQDQNKEYQEMELSGIDAQCFQHEFDHLQGILYLNYASDMKLQRAMKKRDKTIRKLQRSMK